MSFVSRLKNEAMRAEQPLNALLELTYRCNWRCVFCFNPRHHDIQSLSGDEWEGVLDDLRSLGCLDVTLTGGEPLANPDFFRIAEGVRSRRMTLKILTNGTLVDQETAQRIASLYPLSVETSIHGATAEVHDGVTGQVGSFDVAIEAVRLLKRAEVTVVMKTPLTRLNEHQIDALIELADGLGVSYRVDPNITARDDGSLAPMQYAPSRSAVVRAMEIGVRSGSIPELRRYENGFNCGIGRISVAVDPEGNVYPCPQWRQSSLGNVRDVPLRTLWHLSEARRAAAELAQRANESMIRAGEPYSSHSFCPAIAMESTGDPLVPDEAFSLRAEILKEVRGKFETGNV